MKAQRLYGFLVVFVIALFHGEVFGQEVKAETTIPQKFRRFIPFDFGITVLRGLQVQETVIKPAPKDISYAGIGSSYYTDRLGFFCQKELQLQKITSIPFRFRLGSIDYVNYLEQKPNAIKPR